MSLETGEQKGTLEAAGLDHPETADHVVLFSVVSEVLLRVDFFAFVFVALVTSIYQVAEVCAHLSFEVGELDPHERVRDEVVGIRGAELLGQLAVPDDACLGEDD